MPDFLGEYARALTNYQEALSIYQGTGARRGVAQQHNNVGYAYEHLDQPEQAAEQYQRALTVWREVQDRWGEAIALDNLGGVYSRLDQLDKAAAHYEAALALRRAIDDQSGEATTLNNLGVLYHRDLAKPEQGLAYFQQALPLVRAIGDVEDEAVILDNMGLAYLDLDQKEDALPYLRRSIERFDSIRSSMSIEELKWGFADRYASHYRAIVPLLLELNLPKEAFEYAERTRARAFLDQLGNVQIDPRQGADPALIEAEQRLVGEIASLDRRQRALGQQVADPQARAQLAELQARLSAKRAEYADLLLQLKLSNPAYAALVSVDPLPLAQIQTEVLPEQVILVSFFVATDQTIAFAVGRDTFAAVPLAVTRRELAERVTAFRSLLALETENPTDRIVADRLAAARTLNALLLAPLSPLLADGQVGDSAPPPSLIIVPHDVLHYLPFAALVDKADQPLSARFTMSLAPSGSALRYAQANDSPDNGRLLALGNPVTGLPPLPYAEREVTELAALYSSPAILRGAATTETAFRTRLAGVDWLHLAVHGRLEATSPLFSVLYLARGAPVEETAAAAADGRLEVHEIFSLDLSGVNGIVLSACETGLGALSQGDELVGLTRAFLYAGAPVVVASLWPVHDEATAVLMANFHQNLRDGLGPAAALRATQEKVRQIPAWSAPFYWAGFQVIGAGGPAAPVGHIKPGSTLDLPTDGSIQPLYLAALLVGAVAGLGLAGWVIRRRRIGKRV